MTTDVARDSAGVLSTPLSDLEFALLEHRAVHEAVVLNRRDLQGKDRTIAYVVPADLHSLTSLPADLQNRLPAERLPDGYVFLSSIPLDENGGVAADKLARYEVIDDHLIEQWTRAAGKSDSIHQICVMPIEVSHGIGSIHRSELIPRQAVRPQETPCASQRESASAALCKSELAVPAIAHGGPLVAAADEPKTLGEALVRAAERHRENGIVYVRPNGSRQKQSYLELLREAEQILAGLSSLGLKPADRVIFQLADGREFLTAFWACILGGLVPAPVAIAPSYVPSNVTVQRLCNAWELLDRPLILASDALVSELRSALTLSGIDTARVQSIVKLPRAAAVPWHNAQPDDLALILFTSGSTGIPKGVMQSHHSLLCMARGTAQQNDFSSRDVTLNWMPLEHVGAISFLHTMPVSLGCEQVHVPTEHILQDPLRWLDLIDRLRVSITWGPNFAFKLINERSEEIRRCNWNLSSMRFLVSAGEQIVSNTTRQFLDLLAVHKLSPRALRPAFGMSETCSGITWSDGYKKDGNEASNQFVDLGLPIPSASLRIVNDKDQVLTEGEIGRLQVKGPSVTTGYYKNPEATKKAFTKDGWFDTGDLGFLRDNRLTLTGREKDEIVINGINYNPAEVEAVVDAVDGVEVSYSAACGVRRPGSDTDELAIFFSPCSFAADRLADMLRSIREHVATEVGVSATYLVALEKDRIPKTSIGKIQRPQLKRRFAAGEFEEDLKRADLLAGVNTIPEWFFRKVWYHKEPSKQVARTEPRGSLVFIDRHGLGEALCRRLVDAGGWCIVVEPGQGFERLDHARYRIDPKDPDHYRRLLGSVRVEGRQIDQIVHLWTYDQLTGAVGSVQELAQAQYHGTYSVLFLIQALAETRGDTQTFRLQVAGSATQMTSPADRSNDKHATVVGLLKTIPLELAWMRCRHIDLEVDAAQKNAERLLCELRTLGGGDEVAYRGGRRLVWGLAPVDLRRREWKAPPIKPGGIYLISGGLGGIGSYLAQALIRDYEAKLILLGTTRLPERGEWPRILERGGKVADRVRHYMDLESLGGEFVYEAVNVADLAGLREVLAAAEARWNDRLAGVFHLAAGGDVASHWKEMQRHSISNETLRSFEQMFCASVYGIWVLHELVRDRPEAVVVAFSSAIHLFGGAKFSAYAAAHTYLSNFVSHARHHQHRRSYCFSWSVWENIGRSKPEPAFVKDLYHANGYSLIPKELGLDCLIAGLSRDESDLIVGLNADNRNIRRYLVDDATPLQRLRAFFTTTDGTRAVNQDVNGLVVKDRFGTTSQCEFRQLPEMPVTVGGEIARDALLAGKQAGGDQESSSPRTAVEQKIAAVWRDVLQVPRVSSHDSFFASGGNSLSATQAISRMSELFRVRLDVRDLFEHGTVHKLAELVAQRQNQRQPDSDGSGVETTDVGTLLMEVDQMSDHQVAELLGRMQRGRDEPRTQ